MWLFMSLKGNIKGQSDSMGSISLPTKSGTKRVVHSNPQHNSPMKCIFDFKLQLFY